MNKIQSYLAWNGIITRINLTILKMRSISILNHQYLIETAGGMVQKIKILR